MTHRVLIVDDNRISRDTLQDLLTSAGWETEVRDNGIQALQACEQQTFDAVITGFFMPIIDGPHLLGLLKSNPRHQSMPVVMLSTRSFDEVSRHANAEQLAFFMNKPLNCDARQQLVERLTAVVVATKEKAA
ncbi:response regulator [Shewanella submarina]|uniref:Response regulator n=1 Tax=Shewanella submarina TaxID=2016376 RepID=A0ABV7GEY7_9GAMM|nr:response regulator [Shewanella submarina]MCL1037717.1 response regulator [Shewanella submarina]